MTYFVAFAPFWRRRVAHTKLVRIPGTRPGGPHNAPFVVWERFDAALQHPVAAFSAPLKPKPA